MLLFVKNIFNSLKNRVLISALLTVFLLIPIVGLIIINAYEKHMINGINNELSAYSYSILAIVEVENNKLIMPEQLLTTQFNVSQSGLYAAITSNVNSHKQIKDMLWHSQSLLSTLSTPILESPILGQHRFYDVEIEGIPHFVYSFSVSYGATDSGFPMTIHIIKSQNELVEMMAEFQQKLLFGLLGLMAILLLIQYLWSSWTLKPLATLRHELQAIEKGSNDRLRHQYPTELNQVAEQLNLLLNAEQKQRLRYRNALSDLAHSLKTPLAVIQSESQLSSQTKEQLNILNAMVEHQLKKAQSAGQSSWHLGTKIHPISDKLISSLEKIYFEKKITFRVHIEKGSVFKGDESDLLEILGNLLDNACKATLSIIELSIFSKEKQLNIIVKDNGAGIAPQVKEEILQRGTRADTYQSGHGIGLAIVRDLVNSYQGKLIITNSTSLGGAKFHIIFHDNV